VDDLKTKRKKANCAKLLNAQVVDAPEFFFQIRYFLSNINSVLGRSKYTNKMKMKKQICKKKMVDALGQCFLYSFLFVVSSFLTQTNERIKIMIKASCENNFKMEKWWMRPEMCRHLSSSLERFSNYNNKKPIASLTTV
jgi:hypothetical protein